MNIKNTSTLFISLFSITLLFLYGLKDEYAVMLPLLALFGLLIAYGLFWVGGNIALWQENSIIGNKRYRAFLLNLPAFVVFIAGIIFLTAPATPRVAVTLSIVDQEGKPLKGAEIGAVRTNSRLDKGYNAYSLKDKSTIKIVRRTTVTRQIKITKDGYYSSWVSNKLKNEKVVSGSIWPFKHIEPWNPEIVVTLRKIKNPIPLYAKKVESSLGDGESGFDLIKGDWVSPKGKGENAHFKFIVKSIENKKVLFVQVAGENSGFHEVAMNWNNYNLLQPTYNAPASDYKNLIKINPRYSSSWSPISYFFKVSNKSSNKNGGGVFYGKTLDDFTFRSQMNGEALDVAFQYYLNPKVNDTNLEFDSTKNLISNNGNYFRSRFH